MMTINFSSETSTRSYKNIFSIDLWYAGILDLRLAENRHVTFISQWECSNSSVALIYAENISCWNFASLAMIIRSWQKIRILAQENGSIFGYFFKLPKFLQFYVINNFSDGKNDRLGTFLENFSTFKHFWNLR